MRSLFQKISSGQIPLGARIVSQSGDAASMEIHQASITQGEKTVVLLDDKVTLSTNSTPGDKAPSSVASISIPADGTSKGTIRTVGNASVSNSTLPKKVALAGTAKKLKRVSPSGVFVVARTGIQRDSQIEYFDFLFGISGQSEDIDESGKKQRPHITIYPDGNGKFFRLSGHNCEIEGDMQYSAEVQRVLPEQFRIKSIDFNETIEVEFSTENPDEVVLSEIRFTN
jgi:hypothetical protein